MQAPAEALRATREAMAVEPGEDTTKPVWPSRDPDRFVALRAMLGIDPVTAATLAKRFRSSNKAKVDTMLKTLVALGQARELPGGG